MRATLVVRGVLTAILQLLMLEPWLQGRAVLQRIIHQAIYYTVDPLLVLKEGLFMFLCSLTQL
jgi:hypothetical protein